MGILSGLRPKRVFEIFELLCSVPHGSGNTKQISDLIVGFAKGLSLEVTQDGFNNVIIKKPGSKGFENAPPVILQGHMDMVCVKTPECDLDLKKDGLRVRTDGEWVWAEGTSLGGDDGIAVAISLAVLEDNSIIHPPLEVLITVDEETSLEGAKNVDLQGLKGRRLLNLDSEEEGVFTVSCAGGLGCGCRLAVSGISPENGKYYNVKISGLTGGHSGAEIHRQRGNANKLLARFLLKANRELGLLLEDFRGGDFDNVIPKTAEASVWLPDEHADDFERLAGEYEKIYKAELGFTDPGLLLTVTPKADLGKTADPECTKAALTCLFATPDGVQAMSNEVPGLVQTSLNLGVIRMDENTLTFNFSIRSSKSTEKRAVFEKVRAIVEAAGGRAEILSEYPAWEFVRESKVREAALKAYNNVYGGEARVAGIHAGLECGILAEKLPGLDAISFGPDLRDIHSVNERLGVASTERLYRLVTELLKILTEE